MKRLHVHVSVKDLDDSIRFYSTLFGAPPTRQENDYAKWMLDDPRVNFAISSRSIAPGISHLGIQAETADELGVLADRAREAGDSVFIEEGATCCYAQSDKAWVEDPQGIRWETFHTTGNATVYGEAPRASRTETKPKAKELANAGSGGCCG